MRSLIHRVGTDDSYRERALHWIEPRNADRRDTIVRQLRIPCAPVHPLEPSSEASDTWHLLGWANAATGETYGVSGLSNSLSGHGIHGQAIHSTGPTQGVSGESESTNGIGVFGEATASSGPTRGVMGRSDSTDGRGVYGYAGAATGENSGVYGQTASAAGYGVYGENTAGGLAGFFAGDVARSVNSRESGEDSLAFRPGTPCLPVAC